MDNLEQNIMDKSMRSVFVGNIPYEATEEKLKDIFSEVGQVLSFKLVFDRETGKPKGYGFCEYRDQETALSAMRNLNGYEIGGRNLRVDNACTEKSRMEMQNLMQQPQVENPYGDPIQADKAPEAISKAVASLPPEQMFELMKQMKLIVQNNPAEARTMLLQNPQLAYALLQAQVVMRIVDPQTACAMLHKSQQPPPTLIPSEKSITGSVSYFGRIVGMSETQIDNRWLELSSLLDLPPANRRVGECSGGQQRRVSLAASLVHDPELLIMDEPTVGVDPVLREKIWEYLVEITATKNTSIIITTHYIEECRQAHKIGLMRGGKLMAEESPAELIIRFRAETLEEVFLNLSIMQSEEKLARDGYTSSLPIEAGSVSSLAAESVSEVSVIGEHGSTDFLAECSTKKKPKKISPYHVNTDRLRALFYKNWYQVFHNYSGVAFMLLFPLIHMTVFFLAIGADVHDIPLAFVNEENGTCMNFDITKTLVYNNDTDADDCEFKQMSCRFIHEVDDPMIKKIFYTNLTHALKDIESGDVIGVVYFANNFTDSTIERIQDGRFATDFALDFSEIKVWLDMSNRQIGPPIQGKLLEKYVDFTKAMLRECNKNPKMGEIPIRFNEAIYGDKDYTYTIFMTPGMSLTVIYFLAAMMTSAILINDRLEGVWDRTLVAGATTMEVLTAHVTIQSVMIAMQTIEIMVLNYAIFQTETKGGILDIFGLLLTQGWAGMCYGFLISALCPTHTMANFMATGSFYPMLMISGVVWPVEGMPEVLEFVSRNMPFTMPIEALRSIMAKGWGFANFQIIHAYIVTVVWIIGYLLLTFYLLKKNM